MFTDATGAPSFRLLLHTEDDAVQLIRQNGNSSFFVVLKLNIITLITSRFSY